MLSGILMVSFLLGPKAWLSGFDGIHIYLTSFFEWWGEGENNERQFVRIGDLTLKWSSLFFKACAKNAVLTLCICSYFVLALCYGMFSMNVSAKNTKS